MTALEPLAWIAGLTLFFLLSVWLAVRLIRWARKGSKGASLLGWGMELPAAGMNPIRPPQERIEEVVHDIQGRRNSNSSGADE